MVLMAHYRIFRILLNSILALIPKDELALMICSPITQIQKIIIGAK
jgi:hypothetical protein